MLTQNTKAWLIVSGSLIIFIGLFLPWNVFYSSLTNNTLTETIFYDLKGGFSDAYFLFAAPPLMLIIGLFYFRGANLVTKIAGAFLHTSQVVTQIYHQFNWSVRIAPVSHSVFGIETNTLGSGFWLVVLGMGLALAGLYFPAKKDTVSEKVPVTTEANSPR